MVKILALKDWVLAMGAVAGLAAGAYSVIAKPIQDGTKLSTLETRMSFIEPIVSTNTTNLAVIQSRLDKLDDNQSKILDAVLDIKRKI